MYNVSGEKWLAGIIWKYIKSYAKTPLKVDSNFSILSYDAG